MMKTLIIAFLVVLNICHVTCNIFNQFSRLRLMEHDNNISIVNKNKFNRLSILRIAGGYTDDGSMNVSTDISSQVMVDNNDVHNPTSTLISNAIEISSPLSLSNAHAMNVHDCLNDLTVSPMTGLAANEAISRLSKYGSNIIKETPERSLFQMILEQFEDRLVQILLGIAILSAFIASFESDSHAFVEPLVILSVLIINSFVGIYQTQSASNSLQALKQLQAHTVSVLRDSIWIHDMPVADLVPGDIISLRVGNRIPADSRIIEIKSTSLGTDEGCLTGESTVVSKSIDPVESSAIISEKSNILFSGTMVVQGSCLAVVVNTGIYTEIGKINQGVQLAQETHMKTPLTLKLDELGDKLTNAIGIICGIVWLINIPKFSSSFFKSRLHGAVYYAKAAVALGVAAIPEGLPAVITLCLSLGTSRMSRKNVIVRKLPSVETLGCTTVICTDKTGCY